MNSCESSTAMGSVVESYDQGKMECEQARLLATGALMSNFTVTLATVLIVIGLWHTADYKFLLIWMIAMLGMAIVRLALVRDHTRREGGDQDYGFWLSSYAMATAFIGLGWFMLPWLPFKDSGCNAFES